nr:unnamed protein product [Digitaria exilis]
MALVLSAVAIKAAVDGNLRLLKSKNKTDLRESKAPNGWNALHFAAASGHLEVCRFLVEKSGLDANCATADGETPVALAAAAAGAVSLLWYLVDHGGRPATPNSMGRTPLHNAAQNGHTEAVILLLSEGVDVDPIINSRNGGTPLIMAAGKGHDQVVKVLLDHGADAP